MARLKSLLSLALLVLISLALPTQGLCAGKRIGIVYSQSTVDHINTNWGYDTFTYSQLFMAMQNQAMMAGIPFDVLSENELVTSDLLRYDALVIPFMLLTPVEMEQDIKNALREASTNGVGIIASGTLLNDWLLTANTTGVLSIGGATWTQAAVTAADVAHPAMRDYAPDEAIKRFDTASWQESYAPDVTTHSFTVLAALRGTLEGQTTETVRNSVLATENLATGARNIHFANHQVMGDSNLVWSALQWVIYGNQTPVGLKLSRFDSIFLARNDMDNSKYPGTLLSHEIPLYELLSQWKEDYSFVGSFYLNIGTVCDGTYTDWNDLSALYPTIPNPSGLPTATALYTDYIALGNEIGTHSWTHPTDTKNLTAAELECEFNGSSAVIETNLGITVTGAAIPGNPETLAVDWELNSYLDYLSGRYGAVGSGFPNAFGYLTPDYEMLYFSLNMSPDYTLIEWKGIPKEDAPLVWAEEFNTVTKHTSQPIIHWLWHDYGPTYAANVANPLYSVAMYSDTIAMAYNAGTEFATLNDIQQRIRAVQGADLIVAETDPNTVTVTTTATGVGRSSLEIRANTITQVDNWYAYDETQVFLPQNGGTFIIRLGASQEDITHITSLPMRADLISTTGNGTELTFDFAGQGKAIVHLARTDVVVNGADSQNLVGNSLELDFNEFAVHTVTITVCGNGTLAAGEQCDDGNTANGDYCSSDCQTITGTCGDGIAQQNEACDDGNTSNETECPYGTPTCTSCNADCSAELPLTGGSCGNGTIEAGEICDDGNTANGDYCSSDCQSITGNCSDGVTQQNEICDDGNTANGDYCSSDCQTITGTCGDGIAQQNEACDDGNTSNETECPYGTPTCTSCNADCSAELPLTGGSCGNGTLEGGEICDDGNTANGDYCSSDCQSITGNCSDGVTQQNEICDDGNTANGDYCSNDCQSITGNCGDGVTQQNEVCDDGNTANGDYCSNDCQSITGNCGDGIAQQNEACDDGNTSNETECPYGTPTCTSCNADCSAELSLTGGSCGNGTIEAGEACDDGNTENGDCCSSTCTFESSATVCRSATGVCDVAETCTGNSAACPADDFASNGSSCDDGLFCNGNETCQDGACTAGSEPCLSTDLCNEQNDDCQAEAETEATIEVQVTASSDDAEEHAKGRIKLTQNKLDLADKKNTQMVGLRFNGIDIPQGATITRAYIQFQADKKSSDTATLTIWGHATGNAATFSSLDGDISSRKRTTAETLWSPESWNTKGASGIDQQTANISSVIQEIVKRRDWDDGNSLAFLIAGTGKYVAESFDGDRSGAPLLHVEYTVGERSFTDQIENNSDDGDHGDDDDDDNGKNTKRSKRR